MEDLFSKYPKISGNDEFKLFKQFYDGENLDLVYKWIDYKLKDNAYCKSNTKSTELRNKGNKLFGEQQLEASAHLYDRALRLATYNSPEYGMALGNRSAVLFELGKYWESLRDIDLSLQSDYPEDKRNKLYLRKLECLYKVGSNEEIEEFLMFLESTQCVDIADKVKEKTRINHKYIKVSVPESGNDTFYGATNKVRLAFDNLRGRHVVANVDVKVGDVLFLEKAYRFAPLYQDDGNLVSGKCHSCLRDCTYRIPCKTCTLLLYCSESCRDNSWTLGHRFECNGMGLWYDIGIGYAAFRCLIGGIESGFQQGPSLEDSLQKFGDIKDNYPYFNSLLTNLDKMENITPLLITSAIIVCYLKSKTDFMDWLLSQLPTRSFDNPINYIGGLIVRHIAQLSCNSSVINHWLTNCDLSENNNVPEDISDSTSLFNLYESKPVACGIYPAVSIMNHSCKSNVSMYFIQDTIIVKAAEEINMNDEIFNCYGIDYRTQDFNGRQEALRNLYYFTCTCVVCSNPKKEFNYLHNRLVCSICKSEMFISRTENYFKCGTCSNTMNEQEYNDLKTYILKMVHDCNTIDILTERLSNMEMVLTKHNELLYECYYKLLMLYEEKGDCTKAEEYRRKLLTIARRTHGVYSRRTALLSWESSRKSGVAVNDILKLYYPINDISLCISSE